MLDAFGQCFTVLPVLLLLLYLFFVGGGGGKGDSLLLIAWSSAERLRKEDVYS